MINLIHLELDCLSWSMIITLFNAQVKIAPPPTDPCLWIWEATRNWFLKHKSPWEGEAQVGIWRRWSPVSKSHIVMPIPMLLSLQTTKASLPLSMTSACVCVCERLCVKSDLYRNWRIVMLCMHLGLFCFGSVHGLNDAWHADLWKGQKWLKNFTLFECLAHFSTHGKWEMGQSWLLCKCFTCKEWHVN